MALFRGIQEYIALDANNYYPRLRLVQSDRTIPCVTI